MVVALIDYGMGNIHSVEKALKACGAKTIIASRPAQLKGTDKIVLPGVGAFADAMNELRKRRLLSALKRQIAAKKPFLGICLGMQLLLGSSQEAAEVKGLGLIKGSVKKLQAACGLKVPHMGWNQIEKQKNNCPLFRGIPDKSFVYFCHSYYPQLRQKGSIAATCTYGLRFTVGLWQENIYGLQFHPEKSQSIGLKIIKNFVKLC